MNFSIATLGCKVNQYDSAAVSGALQAEGARPARNAEQSDLVVINTCCVTTTAMRKSRQVISRAVRNSPHATVFVLGCYADYDAGCIGRVLLRLGIPSERTVIAGHHDDISARIKRVVEDLRHGDRTQGAGSSPSRSDLQAGPIWNDKQNSAGLGVCGPGTSATSIKTRRAEAVKANMPGLRGLGPIRRFDNRSRAFVKVQDGCDAFCSFCVVPYTRSCVWSRPIEQVVRESRDLAATGHREIVLCGVFLGAYGRGTAVRRRWGPNGGKLAELLRRVADIKGLWRVRVSSLAPGDVTDELLEVCAAAANFSPHFHLPLQSGSPAVLRRMNRQYTPEHYRRVVRKVRCALDRPAITTDIIVGYPGESDADFARTLELAREAQFSKIHIFPFSPIPGTAAWEYRHEAPPPRTVKRRCAALADLERQMALRYRSRFVGESLEGIVEDRPARRRRSYRAMTDRYVTAGFAATDSDRITAGRIVRLRIDKPTDDGFAATLQELL